jgi:hypothetical protein
MIGIRTHAALDYAVPAAVLALAAAPGRGRGARATMTGVSAWNCAYSLVTAYEGGLVPVIGLRTHLACDTAGALGFLAAAALMRRARPGDRLLLGLIGAAQLLVVGLSDDRAGRDAARSAPASRG